MQSIDQPEYRMSIEGIVKLNTRILLTVGGTETQDLLTNVNQFSDLVDDNEGLLISLASILVIILNQGI